jgi:hypothetical protein
MWFWPAVLLGLVWNIFGISQFLSKVQQTVGSLMGGGLTLQQAELYAALPFWMDAAFAIGVFGGTLGCILLLLRSQSAITVLALSLVAYLVLFVGDVARGVFAAFGPPQVAVLTAVVAVAAGLLWLSFNHFKPMTS